MRKLVWSPAALQDLKRLHAFIKPHDPHAALRALKRIKEGAGQLKDFPYIGVALPHATQYRELYLSFGKAAYVVRYRLDMQDQTIITKVWHSRENRDIP